MNEINLLKRFFICLEKVDDSLPVGDLDMSRVGCVNRPLGSEYVMSTGFSLRLFQ